MGSVLKGATTVFNPLAMPIASLGLIPVWGVIRHTGRRSGKRYDTSIALTATADGFVIPLPYGEKTDWCRNVRAANGGVVRWGRHDYTVRDPEVIDRAAAAPAFNPVLRGCSRSWVSNAFCECGAPTPRSASPNTYRARRTYVPRSSCTTGANSSIACPGIAR